MSDPIITEFDEETGEWEIVDSEEVLDEIIQDITQAEDKASDVAENSRDNSQIDTF